MQKHPGRLALCFTAAVLGSAVAHAQGAPRGFWPVADGDTAHTGWQRAETQIDTGTVAKDFKFLWKLKLGNGPAKTSFSEALLFPGMITGKGFKDFAFIADGETLYAVDSELGSIVWKRDFPSSGKSCGNLQVLTEAPQVIHFGAHKPAAKKNTPLPKPPSDDPVPASERRVGGAAGGGYFGLKGVYVLTGDGYLHEQIMATGLDYAKPVKFFPETKGSSFGLNMSDKVVYAATGAGCRNMADTLWSIDLNTPAYAVNSYKTQKVTLAGLTGPAIGADGTAYIVTGSGADNAAAGVYADSVVALDAKDLKVKDWYLAGGKGLHASPIVFPYKNKELVAAPGKDGSLVLLDSEKLGGADHKTPLAETASLSTPAKHANWEGLATWRDKAGTAWLFASIAGPAHGSIAAFKVEEKDGHTVLSPAWTSPDLKNPAPPAVANGIVFALDGGSPSSHATLYALDAATGKQLYASGDEIDSYANLAGMSVGDGHVFFTTHDNTLYSFGIPLEH
jgi:outer membrane protein assembly factor BamB